MTSAARPRRAFHRAWAELGLLSAACLGGCATAQPRELGVRTELALGRCRDAVETAAGERDELLRHLDRALALRCASDPAASNLSLGRADALAEERYTRSLSRAALSLLLNDTVLPYQLDPWERLLIPFYRGLNDVARNEPVDVAVEARRLSALLLERRDLRPDRAAEEGDAFLYAMAGTLFEWAGRPEDAEVAYRNARSASGAAPGWLPNAPSEGGHAGGEIILLVETGFVPPPAEESLFLWLEGDEIERARGDPSGVGAEIAKRYLEREANRDDHRGPGYLLPIALRTRPLPPGPPPAASVEVDGSRRFDVPVGLDLSRAASLADRDELPAVLAKAAARAVLKTLLLERTTDHRNPIVRVLANAAHVVSERADTRAWLSLPGELRLVRIPLEPGPHDLRVTVAALAGPASTDLRTVHVRSGAPTLVAVRVPAGRVAAADPD